MKPRWYEIPEEKAALMFERRQRGESFSKIGRELGMERRAVAKIVGQFEEKQSGRSAIRRDALAQVFRDHLDDMKKAVNIILEVTASPSLRGSLLPPEAKVEAILVDRLSARLGPSWRISQSEISPEAEWQAELKEAVERRLSQRRARAALWGIKEHVANLETMIYAWEEAAAGYEKGWKQLWQAIGKNVPEDLIEKGVKLALQRVASLSDEDSLPRFTGGKRDVSDGPEHFCNIMLQEPGSKRALQIFRQNLTQLERAYERLEDLLSPPQLDQALVAGRCKYCPVP